MTAFLAMAFANKYVRIAGLAILLIAILHVAHCQHDRKLIRDYEAGVQERIDRAVQEATAAADQAAQRRADSFENGQDDIQDAVEGKGEETPVGAATEAYHEALRRLQQ